MMRKTISPSLWLVIGALILGGCMGAGKMTRDQSQQVAKNWFSVIRGAQVFPINPLREDLAPGDLYLVNQTIEEQSNEEAKKGYLPLDHRMARLCYDGDLKNTDKTLHNCVQPTTPKKAGMPGFSFTVDRRSGFQLNLPIDGIPFGLGMVNSNKAVVTVSISDVTVSEIYTIELYRALKDWSLQPENRKYLSMQARVAKHPVMLRAISAVYYTGGVNVSIQGLDNGGASAAIGGGVLDEDNPVEVEKISLENLDASDTKNSAINLIKQLSTIKAVKTLPGGSAQYMKTSENTVSMKDEFKPPLAIGYVGIDVLVNLDGSIGSPLIFFNNQEGLYVTEMTSGDKKELSAFVKASRKLTQEQQQGIAQSLVAFVDSRDLEWKRDTEQFWTDLIDFTIPLDKAEYDVLLQEFQSIYLKEVNR
ncbi:hypothetical protein [uncultured Pseudodesulfovibrio sp.]|uniref:hypothetical protein n=1 Tax=uncultured Pseudodesulfovibrio sp. TaxID=2035858 RepID=UPI0029C7D095|nr:hypothetical protein [uncultured Pseudodesulfovibrio sp.]